MKDCDRLHGEKAPLYDQIGNVLDKMLNEIFGLHFEREQIMIGDKKIKWTNVEIAQLLVAVFNLGEGEWYEIQKRIDFSSSSQIKTPN